MQNHSIRFLESSLLGVLRQNPYQYLLDVLQRVAVHSNSRIEELTPRIWKTLFADQSMGSDVNREF